MGSANQEIDQKLIFFAYQGKLVGRADDNVMSIQKAIESYNRYQKNYIARSWEEYRQTAPISKEVLSNINLCEVFVCDLTYFNHNVLFELGFAMAKDKKIMLLLNERIMLDANLGMASNLYKSFILSELRYVPITNSNCIHSALQNGRYESGLINKFFNIKSITPKTNDAFYIQSKLANQPSLDLTNAIQEFKSERGISLVSDDVMEVKYQTLAWYFQNLLKAKIVLIHLLGENIENSFIDNARNSFFAGIACGYGCDVLLVAPKKYKAPLDYYDILFQYETSTDLFGFVIDWLDRKFPKFSRLPKIEEVTAKSQHVTNLLELGIGCDLAENERSLLSYFIPTGAYQAAVNYNKSLIVGRKGSGKTAIYIKLSDELPSEPYNYVVKLQPEADELLDDVNVAHLYDASLKSFFSAVWRLVIFSKLALTINEKLKLRAMIVELDVAEKQIQNFVEMNKEFLRLNFFGIVREINNRVKKSSKVENPDIMQDLFKLYLSPLIKLLRAYFSCIREQYYKVIILADNLDKTWDPRNDLTIQSEMILTLLEIENKLSRDLIQDSDSKVEIKQIIFLREDIYNDIRTKTSEPDKLTAMAHHIDWERNPNQLRAVIENRFMHILDIKNKEELERKAWKEFFSFKEKKHPYELILEIVTKRPRDLINFFGKLFESAINNDRHKVDNEDLKYAIISYTEFLNNNLIAETRAEFPEIAEILSRLQKFHGHRLEYAQFKKILEEFNYPRYRQLRLIEALFDKEYMLGYDDKTDKPFSDVQILHEKMKEKRFLFLENKVYLIAHAKYYLLKNKSFSPF